MPAEVGRILKAVRESGIPFCVGHNRHSAPAVREAATAGALRHITGHIAKKRFRSVGNALRGVPGRVFLRRAANSVAGVDMRNIRQPGLGWPHEVEWRGPERRGGMG